MIVGAGFAGLIAAHIFPAEQLVEASPEPRESHRALLRFRSDVVARVTGIDFRPVTVRKGIWCDGGFVPSSIRAANLYSKKCLGGGIRGDRSIWSLEPVTRYIAPESFHEQLVAQVRSRITWGEAVDFRAAPRPIISTAPLDVTLGALGAEIPAGVTFRRAPILVKRWRLPRGTDAHQTVYFPEPSHAMYRASITGDLLIAEFAAALFNEEDAFWLEELMDAFGLSELGEALGSYAQRYGKIVPLPDAARKALVHRLSATHQIFSLGRFATWRNLLLDDVVSDASVVKRLMAASEYDRRLSAI